MFFCLFVCFFFRCFVSARCDVWGKKSEAAERIKKSEAESREKEGEPCDVGRVASITELS